MKNKKYNYLYVLQGQYGYGWEDLTAEDKNGTYDKHGTPLQRIRATKRDYQQNAPGSYRIIERRELAQ